MIKRFFCSAFLIVLAWRAPAAQVVFNFSDFTSAPQATRSFVLCPIGAPMTNGLGGIITRDRVTRSTGAGGSLTISNVFGWDYRSELAGTYTTTTNYFTFPVTDQVINAADYVRSPTNGPGGILAYSQSQANARFFLNPTNSGTDGQVPSKSGGDSMWVDMSGGSGGQATNAQIVAVAAGETNLVVATNGLLRIFSAAKLVGTNAASLMTNALYQAVIANFYPLAANPSSYANLTQVNTSSNAAVAYVLSKSPTNNDTRNFFFNGAMTFGNGGVPTTIDAGGNWSRVSVGSAGEATFNSDGSFSLGGGTITGDTAGGLAANGTISAGTGNNTLFEDGSATFAINGPVHGGSIVTIDTAGNVAGNSFAGIGSGLTGLAAGNIASGTLDGARINTVLTNGYLRLANLPAQTNANFAMRSVDFQALTNTCTRAPTWNYTNYHTFGTFQTNAAFTMLPCVNWSPTNYQCATIFMKCDGTVRVITPAPGWVSLGTWNCTNNSVVSVFNDGDGFTNAFCLPKN